MTKLEKLYSIIENSNDVGIKLPQDVIKQVEELEDSLIKQEILPALSSDIEPRLSPIKRDLVLVVEYHPGEPISVALSRKANISQLINAKKLVAATPVPHNPNADLVVTFLMVPFLMMIKPSAPSSRQYRRLVLMRWPKLVLCLWDTTSLTLASAQTREEPGRSKWGITMCIHISPMARN